MLSLDAEEKGPLGTNKDLVIDTLPPYVQNVASSKRNGKYAETAQKRLNLFDGIMRAAGSSELVTAC